MARAPITDDERAEIRVRWRAEMIDPGPSAHEPTEAEWAWIERTRLWRHLRADLAWGQTKALWREMRDDVLDRAAVILNTWSERLERRRKR